MGWGVPVHTQRDEYTETHPRSHTHIHTHAYTTHMTKHKAGFCQTSDMSLYMHGPHSAHCLQVQFIKVCVCLRMCMCMCVIALLSSSKSGPLLDERLLLFLKQLAKKNKYSNFFFIWSSAEIMNHFIFACMWAKRGQPWVACCNRFSSRFFEERSTDVKNEAMQCLLFSQSWLSGLPLLFTAVTLCSVFWVIIPTSFTCGGFLLLSTSV